VLDLGAFDLERAVARDSAFLEPARPYEWAGLYRVGASPLTLQLGADESRHGHGHGHTHTHTQEAHGEATEHAEHAEQTTRAPGLTQIDVALLPVNMEPEAQEQTPSTALQGLLDAASELFGSEPLRVSQDSALPARRRVRLSLPCQVPLALTAGFWGLFSEHDPAEFGLTLAGASLQQERSFGSHHHDLAIASIGLIEPRPLDPQRLNQWLSGMLQARGQDILRMKGVLQLKGEPRRYVFHGVHMTFDGKLERAWTADESRLSRLVFIGRQLNRAELERGLASCIA
ncbi:MAG TPA: GTP-binding protein, partial [Steroidobacteraceae bacterium]|nr:GTP-binding protein [Steroidobacteraceae bacterium]